MSGSVESGRPTPTRTRAKSGRAELALERLQAVVAREPAAEARADLAERQVDLVVHTSTRSSGRPSARRAPARPSGRPRSCTSAAAGPPRAAAADVRDTALGDQRRRTSARAPTAPSASQRVRDLEADVVRRAGVLGARVAEPDDQPVDGRGACPRLIGRLLAVGGGGVAAARGVRPRPRRLALGLADDRRSRSRSRRRLGREPRRAEGRDDRLRVVERSSRPRAR